VFILAVLVFSYAMRSVYIESCAMFVRGGVYRVVKEALGLSRQGVGVALLFDFVLTGPISGVTAGQYIIGLTLEILEEAGSIPPKKIPTLSLFQFHRRKELHQGLGFGVHRLRHHDLLLFVRTCAASPSPARRPSKS